MYLFQIAGYDFNFRFKITYNGIRSRGLDNYIDELLNLGVITDGNGILHSTKEMMDRLSDEYVVTIAEDEKHNAILNKLNSMSFDDIIFLVITAMTIKEVKKKYGINGLSRSNNYVKDTIEKLSNNYSDENLDKAISIIRVIEGR